MRDIRWIKPGAMVVRRDDPACVGVVIKRASGYYKWQVHWLDIFGYGHREDVHAAKLVEAKR